MEHARRDQPGHHRAHAELARRRHGLPAHRRGVQGRAGVAELPHLALHRRLRAHPHSRRHARHGDRHEEDSRARAARAGTGRHHVRAVTQLHRIHRTRLLPSRQRSRRVGVHRRRDRRSSRLVPRKGRHVRARHHRRCRLQRGGRLRALCLAIRAARDPAGTLH
jgi:hypothetical protein